MGWRSIIVDWLINRGFAKALAVVARGRRNRHIMRLAALGHSNAEIAAQVGLHPKSISRIIQKELRRYL